MFLVCFIYLLEDDGNRKLSSSGFEWGSANFEFELQVGGRASGAPPLNWVIIVPKSEALDYYDRPIQAQSQQISIRLIRSLDGYCLLDARNDLTTEFLV